MPLCQALSQPSSTKQDKILNFCCFSFKTCLNTEHAAPLLLIDSGAQERTSQDWNFAMQVQVFGWEMVSKKQSNITEYNRIPLL